MAGGEGRSKLVKRLFVLGLPFSDRLTGREGKWSGLHLLEAPEDGKLEWFSNMVVLLDHKGLRNEMAGIPDGPSSDYHRLVVNLLN